MEKVVHKHLIQYLYKNGLITPEQHGFLKRKSTTTNLLECFNDWTKALDSKKPIDIVYIDVAKAFDSGSSPKLLYKLSKLGIGGNLLQWIQVFLQQRTQCVRVNQHMSSYSSDFC